MVRRHTSHQFSQILSFVTYSLHSESNAHMTHQREKEQGQWLEGTHHIDFDKYSLLFLTDCTQSQMQT
jgi:hypothetical protein